MICQIISLLAEPGFVSCMEVVLSCPFRPFPGSWRRPLLGIGFLFSSCAPPDEAGTEDRVAPISSEAPTSEPQGVSLFGEPLFAVEDTTGVVEEADQALALAPDDVDLIIAAGRVRTEFPAVSPGHPVVQPGYRAGP